MSTTVTDRIEKEVLLRAPRSRVWRAIADAKEFGAWFRVNLESDFLLGKHTRGMVTYPGFEHVVMDVVVERMEPEEAFAFGWHPHAVDPDRDYSREPRTLVEFRLVDAGGSTRLTVTESGFDRLPPDRREEAHRMNDGGWTAQMENIRRHVEG